MGGLRGNWAEPDGGLLDRLTRQGVLAADGAVAGFAGVPVDRDRAAIRAALRALLANGLITALRPEDWPEWVLLDPPDSRR